MRTPLIRRMKHPNVLGGTLFAALLIAGCGPTPGATTGPGPIATPPPTPPEKPPTLVPAHADETHLSEIRQITFGGENAEAYWSADGKELIYQAHTGVGCDQIYRIEPMASDPKPQLVSTGKGATTCSYFFPAGDSILYASTHLGGDACPPPPDRSQGYVWALYDSYDIFKAKPDGSSLTRLTDAKGYDAEATICKKDGSIVFTSVRDGDIDLYRMDADGKNVKRLTNTVGYDGGAFFNADCSKLVWRASRPEGDAKTDYQRLLGQGLVRPSKLDLYVGNADGTDARRVTYLDVASFAPYFFPSGDRLIFSSNYGDPKGREFDLWAINIDGTNLERITSTPGFDGFPMFSPDGKLLAFGSNRATAPGANDTNVFVAKWVDAPAKAAAQTPADRVRTDIAYLADPARDGRGLGTPGLEASGAYIEKRFKEMGLLPAGDKGTFRQAFSVTTKLGVEKGTALTLGDKAVAEGGFRPLAFSAEGSASGKLVLAGYGIREKSLDVDDYKGVAARGNIVVVRRFVPERKELDTTDKKRKYGDIRYKAWIAREQGAKALIVVDMPTAPDKAPADWKAPEEAGFPAMAVDGPGDAGIPVVVVKRDVFAPVLAELEKKKNVAAKVDVKLTRIQTEAFNVVARLPAGAPAPAAAPPAKPPAGKLPAGKPAAKGVGPVILGAHYDHLGRGGHHGSLAPDSDDPHVGADDNASGVAALLEAARRIAEKKGELQNDVLFVAFSAEEAGLLGSAHFTKSPPAGVTPKAASAMINMDMVGRLTGDRLSALGSDSADEWKDIVPKACASASVQCTLGGDGLGASDQMSFYTIGLPVLHFFTGTHGDYHKPSDTVDKINAGGAAQVALLATNVALAVDKRDKKLTFKAIAAPAPRGDLRSFNASLGTIPDYAGPPNGQKGVLLQAVRPGGAADKGGMQRGDILIRLGKHTVGDARDLSYVLNSSRPGETVTAVVIRAGKQVEIKITFQESTRPR